jgi:proline iminopeptidase
MRSHLSIVAALLAAGCSSDSKPAASDTQHVAAAAAPALPAGEALLPVPGGRIWYRKSGTGTGTPVILLHGGPGLNSYYLKPLEALGSDRPVIRYDQLGGGKSDKIGDTTMFTIPHFVAELDSLRSALGFAKVHILGHSWGTILAYEYYKAHPDRVASIVFGSACLDIPAYEKRAKSLIGTLSDSAQKAIKTAEAAKKFTDSSYQNAINEFYGKYVFLRPVPADLDSSFAGFNTDIYNYMQGPSEFTITGTLKTYDVKSQLASLKVPTLWTVGSVDEVGPDLVRGFAKATPGSHFEIIPNSAHITTWDNPDVMVRVVREFLLKADAPNATK